MSELVFLLKEPSAQAMLEGLLPRLQLATRNIPIRYIVFDGKSDLESQLINRLRGYRVPNAQFVILRDKDSADCHQTKARLVQMCQNAGRPNALIRIACHELESWYLADLNAVEQALNIPRLSEKQNNAKYRQPDATANAAEELAKLTNYTYQKVGGSRAIGPHLNIDNTRSHSFTVFISGLRRMFIAAMGICLWPLMALFTLRVFLTKIYFTGG